MGAQTVKSNRAPVIENPREEATVEEIAARAYEIHASGGGHDVENWLRAEQELNTELRAKQEVEGPEAAKEDGQAAA